MFWRAWRLWSRRRKNRSRGAREDLGRTNMHAKLNSRLNTTMKRLEQLERVRKTAIFRASPADIRQRILASLSDPVDRVGGSSRADSPNEDPGEHQLTVRERILKAIAS